jgi:hypothetical protein
MKLAKYAITMILEMHAISIQSCKHFLGAVDLAEFNLSKIVCILGVKFLFLRKCFSMLQTFASVYTKTNAFKICSAGGHLRYNAASLWFET